MDVFESNDGQHKNQPDNPEDVNFNNCLIYVKREWPYDPEDIQMMRAEAVYRISKVFFNQIIPSVIEQSLKPSLN